MNGFVQYAMFRVVSTVRVEVCSVEAFFRHDIGSDWFKGGNAGDFIH
jgi:hypothetical protein